MKNQEMIDKVYEEIADKTLSEGCKFSEKFHWENSDDIVYNKIVAVYCKWQANLTHYISDYSEWTHLHYTATNNILNLRQNKHWDTHKSNWELVYKIIWHPIHYWYAVDWIEKNHYDWFYSTEYYQWLNDQFAELYKDKTKSIEAPENIEALKYLYNLMQWKK